MPEPAHLEVWWAELPERTPRPYLVLTRDQAIPVLRRIVAAPVTRRVRGIPTEVPLGPEEGLAFESIASLDNVETVPKSAFTRRLGALAPARRHELCEALRAAVDC
jgi:mRNA interferase MazF